MGLSGFIRRGVWLVLLVLSGSVYAEKFCLLLAENYYEQLYCEVKAMGKGASLPSLLDFRRNNEMTQALLLKRPAAKIGVEVVMPKKDNISKIVQPEMRYANAEEKSGIDGVGDLRRCTFHTQSIRCDGHSYNLVGNQANSKLRTGALDGANKMDIPVFTGSGSDKLALGLYLTRAYRQYIGKMLEIGLGGSTFSYAKFVFLFHDVTAKGIDFSQRFETMFRFLKLDKQSIAVSEALPDSVMLAEERCGKLNDSLVVCDAGRKNYLYRTTN